MEPKQERRRRAEVKGAQAQRLDQQLWDVWTTTAAAFPHRDAIVSMWQPAHHYVQDSLAGWQRTRDMQDEAYVRWSYERLLRDAIKLALWLERIGCRPDTKLAAVLWNSAEWALFLWAAVKLGMTFLPIDPRAVDNLPGLLAKIGSCVVVVQDSETAEAINHLELDRVYLMHMIQCSGNSCTGWLQIGENPGPRIVDQRLDHHYQRSCPQQHCTLPSNKVAMMVLTSGTTGEPKICLHTHQNLISQTCEYDPKPGDPRERWLVHTPAAHIFAINNTLRAWNEGGTVVFPSKVFDVESTLKALVQEKCTIMSATPTLVKSLLSHPGFTGSKGNHLDLVTIGGTAITQEDIQLCRDGLGANHAIQAYGMTEGAPLMSWARYDSLLKDGYHPGVGKVLPGATARICDPVTREVLTLDEVGELHVAGTSVVTTYFGEHTEAAFYNDGDMRWFKTGDQARIDRDGVVYVMGRYKDIIIRGGQNIRPSEIEDALHEVPGLQAAVVGVPDSLAGEVPVAVVKLLEGIDKNIVAEKALKLGPAFALGGIYTLAELEMTDFPITTLGKVRKGLLIDRVAKHLENEEEAKASAVIVSAHEALVLSLIEAWEQVTAMRPQRDQDVLLLADSISMLRFCDAVVRICGKQIYLQDLLLNNTVDKQASLLTSRERNIAPVHEVVDTSPSVLAVTSGVEAQASVKAHETKPVSSSLSISDLQHCMLEAGQCALKTLGLALEIEDVIPIRCSFRRLVLGQRPQSYRVAFTFRTQDTTRLQVKKALSCLVQHHPLLRATLCLTEAGEPFHAIPAHHESLIQKILIEATVETIEVAAAYADQTLYVKEATPFMMKAALINCKEDGLNYISLTFNHSIMDALAVVRWHRNLDLLLQDETTALPPVAPYSLFMELHDQLVESRSAKDAVAFQVSRLRGISRIKKALWPLQRAPGWMISDDLGSPLAKERSIIREEVWEGRWNDVKSDFWQPRISRLVHLSELTYLLEKYDLTPPNLAKGAITLFNVLQTGASHAIFTSWESSRSWPFLPSWIQGRLPPAMSIDGPTVEWLLNVNEVDWQMTVGEFLKHNEYVQRLATGHQHAPWDQVSNALQEEANIALQASFRQGFVWDVSVSGMLSSKRYPTEFKVLEPVTRHDWADCGLFWNAFLVDPQNLCFIASWDTAQMSDLEVQGHCDTLAGIMRRLSSQKNWSRKLHELF